MMPRTFGALLILASCALAQSNLAQSNNRKLPAHIRLVPGFGETAVRANALPRTINLQHGPADAESQPCAVIATIPADPSIDPKIARKAKSPEKMPVYEGQPPCANAAAK